MDITIDQQNKDVIGFEDPVTLTMTRLEAHHIYSELRELKLDGISPDFVEMSQKLGEIVETSTE